MKRVLSLIAVSSFACSTQNQSKVNIAGGTSAVSDSSADEIASYTIALAKNGDFTNQFTNPRSAFCSAVVLGPKLLLTAAHCAGNPEQSLYFAVFGKDMISAKKKYPNSVRQVAKAIKHPGYPDESAKDPSNPLRIKNDYIDSPDKWLKDHPDQAPNDLAILKLNQEIPQNYKAVTLTDSTDVFNSVTLAGYGITRSLNIDDGGELRFVRNVKVFLEGPSFTPRNQLGAGETVSVKDLAQGQLAHVPCSGDSGGPAFVTINNKLEVLGILSLGEWEKVDPNSSFGFCGGHKGGENSKPSSFYTDVRPYAEWIKKTSAELMAI